MARLQDGPGELSEAKLARNDVLLAVQCQVGLHADGAFLQYSLAQLASF